MLNDSWGNKTGQRDFILLIDWLIDWLIEWLSDSSSDWLIDQSIEWLSDWRTDWFVDFSISKNFYVEMNPIESS